MVTKNVNIKEIIELFSNEKRANFVNVTYVANENGSRTIKGCNALQKQVNANVVINYNFDKKINAILIENGQEPTFESGKGWQTPFIEGFISIMTNRNKFGEKFYLRAMLDDKMNKPKTIYFANGKAITIEQATEQNLLKPSFFNENKSVKVEGIDSNKKTFYYMLPTLNNIIEFTLNGTKYINTDFIDIR